MAPNWSKHLWWILGLASIISLAGWVIQSPKVLEHWLPMLIALMLIALLNRYRVPLAEIEINLAHAVSLTLGIAINPAAAGLALFIGLTLGELVYARFQKPGYRMRDKEWSQLRLWSLSCSSHALSIFGALAAYMMLGGKPLLTTQSLPHPIPALGLAVVFTGLFLSFHWLTLQALESRKQTRQETITLFLVALLPVPFAFVSAAVFAQLGPVALMVLGGVVAVISPIMYNLAHAERDLQRRLRELSTISEVSQAMRTSLNMDSLLTSIYLQVAHLLHIDNFYVALIHPEEKEISYPIAIRGGQREAWPKRPVAHRLTERVVYSAAPVLIPTNAPDLLRDMGLPELDNPPEAWLGVPLSNPERTFGCLAVFHTEKGKSLSETDLDVLLTLAGQASVAIDNAMLYEQTRQRAKALASLNKITASISSTLDPERALELVSKSMIQFGGGQKSAIFLLDPDRQQLFLARVTNLSDDFIHSEMTISLEDEERTAAIHDGSPFLVQDLKSSTLSKDRKELLLQESINAFAEFPLTTPAGTIGQVSVYFAEPQRFKPDQIELLKTFAGQAGLAVANARVHAETDQALRRRVDQLSTLESIGREMTATLDPDELSEIILHHALRITNTLIGHLVIFEPEGNGIRVAAQTGCSPDSRAGDPHQIYEIGNDAVGRAFQLARPQNIPDLSKDPRHIDWSGKGTRCMLCVPIVHKGRTMGVVSLESLTPGSLWPEHEQFISQLASQAAVAMSNAMLYKQLQTHLHEQSLLFQAGTRIAATLDSESVAAAVADSLTAALSVAVASVFRCDPEAQNLELQIAIDGRRPISDPWKNVIPLSNVPAYEKCLQEGSPIQWSAGNAPSQKDLDYLEEHPCASSLLAIPLTAGDETLGLVEIASRKGRTFDESVVRIAQTIANQAAIALQNTNLFRRIQENQEHLMAVLNSTREGMVMVDPWGKILIANRQFENITHLALERLIGSNLSHPDLNLAGILGYSAQELSNRLKGLQSGDLLLSPATTYSTESAHISALERSESLVRDSSGDLIGWLLVLRDVTKERKLTEARKQLTEMIVHDLRSPLTANLNSLRIIEKSLGEVEEVPVINQAVVVAERSCEQMLGLVNSLLDIAEMESGKMDIAAKPLSITQLCQELIATYVQFANDAGIILNSRIPEEMPAFSGDEEKLQRVFSNLIDNALKFTPAGGRVDISLRSLPDTLEISVADTGPGVPAEFKESIFERFSQIPTSGGRRRGTGLGLTFAKLAVEAHRGRIWVEDNPGGGSVFRIHLPLENPNNDEEEMRDADIRTS